MKNIVSNTWSSIAVMVNDMVEQMQPMYPNEPLSFYDWETHANNFELPESDLIGPMTMGLVEEDQDMFELSFAIGISTYASDTGLFRLREYADVIFDRLTYGNKLKLYNARTGVEEGLYTFVNGTMLAPMSRADVRPFQYIQCVALLIPQAE